MWEEERLRKERFAGYRLWLLSHVGVRLRKAEYNVGLVNINIDVFT